MQEEYAGDSGQKDSRGTHFGQRVIRRTQILEGADVKTRRWCWNASPKKEPQRLSQLSGLRVSQVADARLLVLDP
jgi:hypothetical protein